jgi:hypothetical protein
VTPEAWQQNGGSTASLNIRGGKMNVTHTADGHRQLQVFFDLFKNPRPVPMAAQKASNESTTAPADSNLVIAVYSIRNLPAGASGMPIQPNQTTRMQAVDAFVARLIDEVAPKSWRDKGGNIGMCAEVSGLLIIAQTPENQAAVAKWLDGVAKK